MGACVSAPKVTEGGGEARPRRELKPWQDPARVNIAEKYLEHQASARSNERQRQLLNARVAADSRTGGRSRAGRASTVRSAARSDCDDATRSQHEAFELYARNSSLSRASNMSLRTSSHNAVPLTAEQAAARDKKLRERLRKEEEELAVAMAVSVSEAEATAAAMAEPISLEDAEAIAAAQAELNRRKSLAAAARAQQQQGGHSPPAGNEFARPAAGFAAGHPLDDDDASVAGSSSSFGTCHVAESATGFSPGAAGPGSGQSFARRQPPAWSLPPTVEEEAFRRTSAASSFSRRRSGSSFGTAAVQESLAPGRPQADALTRLSGSYATAAVSPAPGFGASIWQPPAQPPAKPAVSPWELAPPPPQPDTQPVTPRLKQGELPPQLMQLAAMFPVADPAPPPPSDDLVPDVRSSSFETAVPERPSASRRRQLAESQQQGEIQPVPQAGLLGQQQPQQRRQASLERPPLGGSSQERCGSLSWEGAKSLDRDRHQMLDEHRARLLAARAAAPDPAADQQLARRSDRQERILSLERERQRMLAARGQLRTGSERQASLGGQERRSSLQQERRASLEALLHDEQLRRRSLEVQLQALQAGAAPSSLAQPELRSHSLPHGGDGSNRGASLPSSAGAAGSGFRAGSDTIRAGSSNTRTDSGPAAGGKGSSSGAKPKLVSLSQLSTEAERSAYERIWEYARSMGSGSDSMTDVSMHTASIGGASSRLSRVTSAPHSGAGDSMVTAATADSAYIARRATAAMRSRDLRVRAESARVASRVLQGQSEGPPRSNSAAAALAAADCAAGAAAAGKAIKAKKGDLVKPSPRNAARAEALAAAAARFQAERHMTPNQRRAAALMRAAEEEKIRLAAFAASPAAGDWRHLSTDSAKEGHPQEKASPSAAANASGTHAASQIAMQA